MEVNTIDVRVRTEKGSAKMAKLRAEGFVPAVLYGGGRDNLSVVVSEADFARELRAHNKVFELTMEGKKQAIFLQDVQWDCLSDRPLHADFRRIELDQWLDVMVELTYIGHPKGATRGGTLVKDLPSIKLACMPAAIPDAIEVNVAGLDVGEKLRAGDLDLPENVKLAGSDQELVCHLTGDETPAEEPAAEEEGGEG